MLLGMRYIRKILEDIRNIEHKMIQKRVNRVKDKEWIQRLLSAYDNLVNEHEPWIVKMPTNYERWWLLRGYVEQIISKIRTDIIMKIEEDKLNDYARSLSHYIKEMSYMAGTLLNVEDLLSKISQLQEQKKMFLKNDWQRFAQTTEATIDGAKQFLQKEVNQITEFLSKIQEVKHEYE